MQERADGEFGSVEMVDVKRVVVMIQRGTERVGGVSPP